MVPKSIKAARLAENLDIFGFELSAEEVQQISALNRNRRYNDPGVYTKFFSQFYPIFG